MPNRAFGLRKRAFIDHRDFLGKSPDEGVRDTWNAIALLEQFPGTQVPTTFRALAEQNLARMRELYEGSKNTFQAVLESWQQSFGEAGQGAAALNRRFIDLAERNVNTGSTLRWASHAPEI